MFFPPPGLIFDQKPVEGRLALLALREKKNGSLKRVMSGKKRLYMLTREREASVDERWIPELVKGEDGDDGDDEMR
jgi:hypothetical protein